MEHVNNWCFRDIYKDGLWEDDLYVCAQIRSTVCTDSGHILLSKHIIVTYYWRKPIL